MSICQLQSSSNFLKVAFSMLKPLPNSREWCAIYADEWLLESSASEVKLVRLRRADLSCGMCCIHHKRPVCWLAPSLVDEEEWLLEPTALSHTYKLLRVLHAASTRLRVSTRRQILRRNREDLPRQSAYSFHLQSIMFVGRSVGVSAYIIR